MEAQIWSQSDKGTKAHAYPDPEGSALCRKNLPARRWMPDFRPSFRTADDMLLPLCPRCVALITEGR